MLPPSRRRHRVVPHRRSPLSCLRPSPSRLLLSPLGRDPPRHSDLSSFVFLLAFSFGVFSRLRIARRPSPLSAVSIYLCARSCLFQSVFRHIGRTHLLDRDLVPTVPDTPTVA
ncbi:hypothetical protein K474DRAFT_959197 [Panus rudis PR-1116 ss-1]|nr:hypothetical protein K474DRAFT_959197 [Panus rudis PR-1116 ss-1]